MSSTGIGTIRSDHGNGPTRCNCSGYRCAEPYDATGATVTADALTVMAANYASTSNDDSFGTIDVGP